MFLGNRIAMAKNVEVHEESSRFHLRLVQALGLSCPSCMKINHSPSFALVGWYLTPPPPVLSGTTNVLDTGAPLDYCFIALLRFGIKVIDSRRDKKRMGGSKPSR